MYVETIEFSSLFFNFWSTDPTHKKDYYKILGVSSDADQKQIKKAYFDVSITFEVFIFGGSIIRTFTILSAPTPIDQF